MTIQESVIKAIAGGWQHDSGITLPPDLLLVKHDGTMGPVYVQTVDKPMFFVIDQLLFDPSFWQSLGNAMGWVSDVPHIRWSCKYDGCACGRMTLADFSSEYPDEYEDVVVKNNDIDIELDTYHLVEPSPGWRVKWRSFIGHLAEGKGCESFFAAPSL